MKAARGAGFSWGLAEEAGFAVQWLQARGLPAVQSLAEYLSWCDSDARQLRPVQQAFKPESSAIAPFCPITLGASLADHGPQGLSQLPAAIQLCQPLLIAPFIAAACDTAQQLQWYNTTSNQLCTLTVKGPDAQLQTAIGALTCNLAECSLQACAAPKKSQCYSRIEKDQAHHMATLNDFAARTYAPATEASRMAGAGAGLNDND